MCNSMCVRYALVPHAACARLYTRVCTCIHVYTRVYIRVYTRVYIRVNTRVYTRNSLSAHISRSRPTSRGRRNAIRSACTRQCCRRRHANCVLCAVDGAPRCRQTLRGELGWHHAFCECYKGCANRFPQCGSCRNSTCTAVYSREAAQLSHTGAWSIFKCSLRFEQYFCACLLTRSCSYRGHLLFTTDLCILLDCHKS